ncbi:E3 ubiquitin-protein ligase RNF43 isoform X2 [Xenopus laevis]|uniref:RING-type E3 ubiquitin transferase n=1 Tax=Xenopus laevis TaxID=8355 RepID=A0A8J0UJP2_XENLA|nr:E3 ubiquitin-protein ligase RNF43 isoform X2 [Xenopus laevis]
MNRARLQLASLWLLLAVTRLQAVAASALGTTERDMDVKALIRVRAAQGNLTLEGLFARVAEISPAEGKLLQFHPLSLCNTSEDDQTKPGFISIVKLETPDSDTQPCLSLANKARLAGERGAHAILFDISNDRGALQQLHHDVWILLTLSATVLFIILCAVARLRCRQPPPQDSIQQQTLVAISCLATRRYQQRVLKEQRASGGRVDTASTSSSVPVCAICLEEFTDGQELRILPCCHEYHLICVDPWLRQNHTCPLCMYDILDSGTSAQPPAHRTASQTPLWGRYPGSARLMSHLPPNGLPMVFPTPDNSIFLSRAPYYLDQTHHWQTPEQMPMQIRTHRRGAECPRESGYLPDDPGSDSSSGPCHGSSSENCTDISLHCLHGTSSSSVHSSQSNQEDSSPPALASYLLPQSELPALNPLLSPQASYANHVHFHQHRHHHYRRNSHRSKRRTKVSRADPGYYREQRHITGTNGESRSLMIRREPRPSCSRTCFDPRTNREHIRHHQSMPQAASVVQGSSEPDVDTSLRPSRTDPPSRTYRKKKSSAPSHLPLLHSPRHFHPANSVQVCESAQPRWAEEVRLLHSRVNSHRENTAMMHLYHPPHHNQGAREEMEAVCEHAV